MTIIDTAIIWMIFIAYVGFAGKRLLTYMHVLQQEDYDNSRLWTWMTRNKAFDKRVTIGVLVVSAIMMAVYKFRFDDLFPDFIGYFLIFLIFAFACYVEKDPRKDSKKKLVATSRAKRIFLPAFAISVLLGVFCFYMQFHWPFIFIVQALPFILMIVNLFLWPFEQMVQNGYWREAHTKVQDLKPTVIGITGSYGKTSVKHILGHILQKQAPTLMTPGSVNTPMGITRVIREQLEPNHKYLIVEMGAYGPGSIKHLCDLTPPDFGIISTIGHAHYERFKSLETVSKAKFELAEAIMEKEGTCIIHERTLRFPYPREMKNAHPGSFVVCGDAPEIDRTKEIETSYIQPEDLQIHAIQQKSHGLAIKMAYKNVIYTPEIPIFGIHHAYNIALAFACAVELGIDTDDIQDALATLPQIRHRLEVIGQPDGTTIIDDAYNSNPIGFQSALSILEALGKDRGGRKILITPGMIELGVAHDEVHEKIGAAAGESCDIVIVIGGKRIPTFMKGFKSTGSGKTLKEFESFQEAQSWFIKNKQDNDILLLENDLPDMYERIPVM